MSEVDTYRIPGNTPPNNEKLSFLERTRKKLGELADNWATTPVPEDLVVTGYKEPSVPELTEAEIAAKIAAGADRVDDSGWVHGGTSGSMPKMTPELLAQMDADKAREDIEKATEQE